MIPPKICPTAPIELHRLNEYDFEDLCCDIFDSQPEISFCENYGIRGQAQYGVDLIAYGVNDNEIEVGQCKCYRKIDPANIRGVSDEFFKHWDHWSTKGVKRFILFVACELRDQKIQDQILEEKNNFSKYEIKYEVWSSKKIVRKLHPFPEIVRKYFTTHAEAWLSLICGVQSPTYPVINSSSHYNTVVVSAIVTQSEQLVKRVATDIENQLKEMQICLREGRDGEVKNWINDLKNEEHVWSVIPSIIKAKVLNFEIHLMLNEANDLNKAKTLLDESRLLSPSEDQSKLRALITFKESGPKHALAEIQDHVDIDSLNLKAALLLESKDIDHAWSTLEAIVNKFQPSAETYRLRSLAHVFSKDMGLARLEINKALEIAPRWKSVRIIAGIINYLSTLSPAILSGNIINWPEPVDWSFVKRDEESISRLKQSSAIFLELSKNAIDTEERKHFEAWRLACLANDPDCQEDAIRYCREILSRDKAHWQAIVWALARNFGINLRSSEKKIKKLIRDQKADLPHIIALVGLYLASGDKRTLKALELLEDSKPMFEKQADYALWSYWHSQALVVNDDPKTALKILERCNQNVEIRHSKSVALRMIARKTSNWQPLLEHLKESHIKTNDPIFLYESCELMAHLCEWSYIVDHADELVKELQTTEALRLAVIAANNAQRFDYCLDLLDQNRSIFQNKKLPNELRRIRVLCCQKLGFIPEAISEAEALVQEDYTTNHLIDLASLYFSTGDLASLVLVARKLLNRADMDSEKLMQLAYIVQWEDRELAINLWKLGNQYGVPDDQVSLAVELGYKLGLDLELKTLLVRLHQLGKKSKGGIQMATIKEISTIAKNQHEQIKRQYESYQNGLVPVHLFSSHSNLPLAHIYHLLLQQNENQPEPMKQFSVFIRHGGRSLVESIQDPAKYRLCMDITALLLSVHLRIISDIERAFRLIAIPADAIPALTHMKDQLTPHQPKLFENYQEIVELVKSDFIKTLNPQFILKNKDEALIEEVDEDFATLYEYARENKGYIVDFLPVKNPLSDITARLPENAYDYLTNFQAIIESLRQEDLLSDSEYRSLLQKIGSEENKYFIKTLPKPGDLLICRRNIPELLASAGILKIVCKNFKVVIEQQYFDLAKSAQKEYLEKYELRNWLSWIINTISKGIQDGVYEILPYHSESENDLNSTQIYSPVLKNFFSLMNFTPIENDIIWSDDRFVNSYIRRDAISIIGINEVLKTLFSEQRLGKSDYFEKILRLRSANTRYIPIEKEEILYHLEKARIENDKLVESRSLKIIRRYVSTCLYQCDLLQHPPMAEESPNKFGEIPFIMSLIRTINDSILEVWAKYDESDKLCEIQADWLLDNLYLDHAGAYKCLSLTRTQLDEKYFVAIGLAGLISQAIGLVPTNTANVSKVRKKYFDWLFFRLLKKRFDANPDLILGVAECLKKIIDILPSKAKKRGWSSHTLKVLQDFYDDLPALIKEELNKDAIFMARVGKRVVSAIDIGGLNFLADDFLHAATEAINGRVAKITTIDSNQEIKFYSKNDPDKKGYLFIENPANGSMAETQDELFEILNESTHEREVVLHQNRHWFDCSYDTFVQAVGEIVTTEDTKQRFEKTQWWRNSSSSVYYENITKKIFKFQNIELKDVLPPSADGLLRHFRFQIKTNPKVPFDQCYKEASELLLNEEGLYEAIRRLSGFPIPLPSMIIEAVTKLSKDEGYSLVKKLLKTAGSPVSRIHLVHILTHLNGSAAYKRLARKIVLNILNSKGNEEFKAFLALLKWMNNEFGYWREARQWPAPIRLGLVWAHSHKLFAIFKMAGASFSWINETFEKLWFRLPFDLFVRSSDYWSDIAHPRQVSRESFILTGLYYGLNKSEGEVLDKKLINAIHQLTLKEYNGNLLPELVLLRDSTQAKNGINSFLARDKGQALHSLLKQTYDFSFEHESLLLVLRQALDRLSNSSDYPFDWTLIHAIAGDFCLDHAINTQLKKVICQTDFVALLEKNKHIGIVALLSASMQTINFYDEDVRCYVTDQLIDIAKTLSQKEQSFGHDQSLKKQNSNDKIEILLLEAAMNLAVASQLKSNVASDFGNIVTQIVENWNKTILLYRPIVQRLCDELPLNLAKDLWPLLLRLRTE